MSRLFRLTGVLLLFLAFGCAHRITVTPEVGTITGNGISKIEKNVGYYISPEDLAREVVTGGGGGDKVKYLPYKESEPALMQVLSNIFKDVHALKSGTTPIGGGLRKPPRGGLLVSGGPPGAPLSKEGPAKGPPVIWFVSESTAE